MTRTKVFATKEELAECMELAAMAARTPVIAFSSEHALKEGGLSGQAWRLAEETVHKYALAHGLPEIPGYYGITTDGEFVKV